MAGSRIKGITIEIDGNTTKLQSALSGVNKDLRSTQSSLRDVNKLLKLDPTNVTLLKQKQDLLKKTIDETKQKIDKEKEALSQLKKADQTPEVISQQQALERQIADDENALAGLTKEASGFGSAGLQAFFAVGEQVKAVGEKIKSVGEGITKNVTVPLMAIGGASIAAFKSVDEGYDTMIKKTGATGEAAEEMIGIIDGLATTIPTSFDTAGAAVGEVNTRFGVTGDELEDLSSRFIKFADLNDTDVSGSIDKVQKALSAYGLGADDAGALLDRLNITGQETGISVDKLADGVVNNAAAFQEMGLSVDQSVGLMGQLEKSGADADTVMGGLRKALKNATKDGKPLNRALSELQSTIKDGTGSTDGLTAAYDLFGKSGDAIYAAVKNGTIDFEALGQAVSDAGGSVENTFAATQDPIDKFTTTLNQMKITGAEVGASLLEVLAPILEKVSEVFQQIREKWESLSPETQDMIIKAAMIAAAVGPIITVLGTLITAIGALMSPIGLVVLAIAGAIAAGVALYKNWDKVKAAAQKLYDKIKNIFEKIKAVIQIVWDTIKAVIQARIDAIQNIVTTVFNAVRDFIKTVWETIKTTISNVWNGIKNVVSVAINSVKNTVCNIFNTIKNTASTIWSGIKSTISTAWEGIKSGVSTAADKVKSTVSTAWNSIKDNTPTVWNAIKTSITNPISTAKTTISTIVSGLKSLLSFMGLDTTVSNMFNSIKNALTGPIQSAKNTISGIVSKIKGFFPIHLGNLFSGIKLPHFSLRTASRKILGKTITYPTGFNVEWYAKGGIFTQPTLFQTPSGMAGVGEAGAEAVLPLSMLWQHMEEMGNSIVQGVTASNQTSTELMYQAMVAAFSEMSFSIGNREFARILREHGAI